MAWLQWMERCFDLTDGSDALRRRLAVSSRSIASFIDDTIDAVAERRATVVL
ncbi:hypothetical protein [Actinomadura madurae]|nr:hypothetical protein [Actinomadura madurae]MCP9955540.1 hypothetical protein [Actinomadura madurae]MCP9984786.1 hypothetical protein [Actinomadura madurae]URN00994.1 hypothetical protein LUW76_45560 [Actinomadura madurae]URN03143.1 hypothetical protein LUW74_07145 [Actinomadura madurae]